MAAVGQVTPLTRHSEEYARIEHLLQVRGDRVCSCMPRSTAA
jgi:hypothetical protein